MPVNLAGRIDTSGKNASGKLCLPKAVNPFCTTGHGPFRHMCLVFGGTCQYIDGTEMIIRGI